MKIDNKLILENSKNLTILYVEDDDLLRSSTSQLFSNFFERVDVANDGQEGLNKYIEYFQENDEAYDLVISDINMPNMDGLDMCEKIKAISYDQVFVFITAFNESNYLHSAIRLGVSGFLTKPIEMEQLKNVLYRSTQMITDRKLVLQHYDQIEKLNSENISKKENFSSSKDILDDLIQDKEHISNVWVSNEIVKTRLDFHSIDVEFFRSHYGLKVIEYFLNVIKGEAKVGNCPVIITMLQFFKNKNLPLADIFIICVNFKNTVTAYLFDKYGFNQKLFDEVSLILDSNFEGVIQNYPTTKQVQVKQETKSIEKEEVSKPKINEEEVKEVNYSEYVLENDVYELQDLEEEIDSLAVLVIMNNNSTLEDNEVLGNKIQRYGTILSNYPLFSRLGGSIMKLGVNLTDNAQLLFDDRQRVSNITALIEGFINDLIIWRKEIFENNIDDAHFLDASFFSNVDTIIMFIEYDEANDSCGDENEIEFF